MAEVRTVLERVDRVWRRQRYVVYGRDASPAYR